MADNKQENKDQQKQEEQPKQEQQITVLTEFKNHLRLLTKALKNNDTKQVQKLTKQVRRFKKVLLPHHMEKIWKALEKSEQIPLAQLPQYEANFEENFEISKKLLQNIQSFPEVQLYVDTFLVVFLFHQRDIATDASLKQSLLQQASSLSEKLLTQSEQLSVRSFDHLNAIIYFYYFRAKELQNQLLQIRQRLFDSYRTACLRFDEIGQATLLNLLLRNYLHFNHYEAAHHLVQKSTFPESKSNNEHCRYLYYTGRIKAIQLDYASSLQSLNQAIRKAPDSTALGFRIEAQKLAIVVELLLGDIPERSIFAQSELQKPLIPYYKLVQSILKGNLLDYSATVAKYAKYFIRDKLYTLITRLHQIVIKTGLRKINLSYSRISFADIAQKLQLTKNTDVELIVAKAIRDGVLQAEIDHTNKWIIISERKDLYNTNEPSKAFQKRIDYCLNLYNQATKALQYPNQNFNKLQEQNKNGANDDEELDEEDMFSDIDF